MRYSRLRRLDLSAVCNYYWDPRGVARAGDYLLDQANDLGEARLRRRSGGRRQPPGQGQSSEDFHRVQDQPTAKQPGRRHLTVRNASLPATHTHLHSLLHFTENDVLAICSQGREGAGDEAVKQAGRHSSRYINKCWSFLAPRRDRPAACCTQLRLKIQMVVTGACICSPGQISHSS